MSSRSFRLAGSRNGSLVHVTWTDGVLTGDPPTVDLLETQAEIVTVLHADKVAARAFPDLVAGTTADPLADPASAYHLIVHVFDTVREQTGDLPDRDASAGVPSRPAS